MTATQSKQDKNKSVESVADILRASPAMRQLREFARQKELLTQWEKVVGSSLAEQARALRYRNGKLQVAVQSAPLLQELSTFRKSQLLKDLKQCEGFTGLVDIVFKHG